MSDPLQQDTSELLADARCGDRLAKDRLLGRYRDRLRRMVAVRIDERLSARVDASDVVQETLMLAAKLLADYLRDPPLPFYPWLRQIAWNRLVALRRHLEANKRNVRREQSVDISNASAVQLAERLASRKEAVQRVRFVLPLRAHRNARPAARAWLAAALLAAEERSPDTCEKLAARLGLNMDNYETYVADPATDQEIDRRIEWLDEKNYPGLSVIWIENQELLGAQTHAALESAWQRATRR